MLLQQLGKLKFIFLYCSNESGGPNGVSITAGQSGTHWPSALAAKLKFDFSYMNRKTWEIILSKRRWMMWMNLIVK